MELHGVTVGFSHVPISVKTNKSFNCNELTFVNKGSTTVHIYTSSVLELLAGQAVTYPCTFQVVVIDNKPHIFYEFNCTVYSIIFPGGNANGNLLVAICKNFIR